MPHGSHGIITDIFLMHFRSGLKHEIVLEIIIVHITSDVGLRSRDKEMRMPTTMNAQRIYVVSFCFLQHFVLCLSFDGNSSLTQMCIKWERENDSAIDVNVHATV